MMKGVQYLVDGKGKPKAVVIDLRRHGRLWEDFQDLLVAEQRRHAPRETLEEVKAILKKKRKENGRK